MMRYLWLLICLTACEPQAQSVQPTATVARSVAVTAEPPNPMAAAGCASSDWGGMLAVIEVHPSPNVFSGRVASFQEVTYQIESTTWARSKVTLKPGDKLRVSFPIIAGSALLEPGQTRIRDVVTAGATHLACLRLDGERWIYTRTQVP